MQRKIFVVVRGGVAYAMEDTIPEGFELEIVDFDNIAAGDRFSSNEARRFCEMKGLWPPDSRIPKDF
jgi:hypothetical protein